MLGLRTTKGGFSMSVTTGGIATGFVGDCTVLEGCMKTQDAGGEAERARVEQWHHGTIGRRLNDVRVGVIISILSGEVRKCPPVASPKNVTELTGSEMRVSSPAEAGDDTAKSLIQSPLMMIWPAIFARVAVSGRWRRDDDDFGNGIGVVAHRTRFACRNEYAVEHIEVMPRSIGLLDGQRTPCHDIDLAKRACLHRDDHACGKNGVPDPGKIGGAGVVALKAPRRHAIVIGRGVERGFGKLDDVHGRYSRQ